MNATNLMINFREMLKSALPFFESAGLAMDTYEWEDFLELSFELLVAAPVHASEAGKISWKYGTWDRLDQGRQTLTPDELAVIAMAEASTPVLLGVRVEKEAGDLITFWREEVLKEPTVFLFREFAHPLREDRSAESLDHVLGEIVRRGHVHTARTKICVPARECCFDFRRLQEVVGPLGT